MGSVLATIAFKAFELMYSTYKKKHPANKEKTKREKELELMLKKQNELIAKAKDYCTYCEAKVKSVDKENARLKSLVAALTKRPIDSNPYSDE